MLFTTNFDDESVRFEKKNIIVMASILTVKTLNFRSSN